MWIKDVFRPLVSRQQLRAALKNAPKAHPVHSAIERTLAGDAKPLFARIEQRRQELLADRAEIDLVDFGAKKDGSESTRNSKSSVADAAKPSKPAIWASFLHHLAEITGAKSALELGTCVGISGSYIASATGRLTSLEGDPERSRLSRETFKKTGIAHAEVITGPFDETLPRALRNGPFDFVFIDGHHDGPATIRYFEQIRPHLTKNAIVIFDDIRWSEGMKRAWLDVSKVHADAVDCGLIGVIRVGI
jgi:predicted O-methyltransferase YrrM